MRRGSLYISRRLLINALNLPGDIEIHASGWDSDRDAIRLYVNLPNHMANSGSSGLIYKAEDGNKVVGEPEEG